MITLASDLIDLLQVQLTLERYASQAYSAFESVCEAQSFSGFARWHHRAAKDERHHAALVRDFLIARNVAPLYDALDAVTLPVDYLSTFSAAQELEATVTSALSDLYARADEYGDPQVCRLASDMLIEQRESERELYDIVTRLQFALTCPAAILTLEQELGGSNG